MPTRVPDRPTLLLWVNEATVYRDALARAGLAERVALEALSQDAAPEPALLERCDAMLAWRLPPGLLLRMPRLAWVQAMTAAADDWLARDDLREGLTLTCARGVHRISMPENILAALFHLTKPYAACAADQRERRWTRRVSEPLAGKTLGILGLGTIGREVARKAAALELRVLGTRRTAGPVPEVARVYPPEATDEVLAASDFVLLLMPVTPATRGFMDARRLAAMRPTAYLLNFARGALVVDADLVAAVRARTIAGAVLDVFRQEPLPPEHPFWTTEGITVLPHIGAPSRARRARRRAPRRQRPLLPRGRAAPRGRGPRARVLTAQRGTARRKSRSQPCSGPSTCSRQRRAQPRSPSRSAAGR
jgi:phosphoglycerate dehydrogenase-like enzyme